MNMSVEMRADDTNLADKSLIDNNFHLVRLPLVRSFQKRSDKLFATRLKANWHHAAHGQAKITMALQPFFVETASKGKQKPENMLDFNALSVIIHPIRAICLPNPQKAPRTRICQRGDK